MARLAGKAGAFKIDATVPADPVGVTSWELDYKGEAVDITGMDSSGVKEFIAGLTEAAGTATLWATDDAQNPVANTEIRPGLTCVVWLFHAATDAASWNGNAIITDVKPTVQVSGAVEYNISFQFTGAIAYEDATP